MIVTTRHATGATLRCDVCLDAITAAVPEDETWFRGRHKDEPHSPPSESAGRKAKR